uniref:DUF4440 domain-containing protein n=1 Tax=Plectus sambesii TaxID=2011161 RepID=A0A914UND5_9BILA
MKTTKEQFQKLHEDVVLCMESNDFLKMLDYITDNYIHHIPFMKKHNHKQHKDSETLHQKHRMLNDDVQKICTIEALDIFGDIAIDRGTFTMKPPCKKEAGNYLCVWKKEDGKWKIFDICVTKNGE